MLEILKNRRSVRQFIDKNIEEDKIELLKESLLLSPTSRNLEPCEFIMIRDKDTLKKLATAKPHGAGFLENCDTAFIICGDTEKSDVCIEDCSIASIILQLTAESLGLGSCWAQIRLRQHDEDTLSEEYVRGVVDLPDRFAVISVIGIAYPASKPEPKSRESLKDEKIHAERYNG